MPADPSQASAPAPPLGKSRRIRDYFQRYRIGFAFGILFLILTQAMALTVPRVLRSATDALVAKSYSSVIASAELLAAIAVVGTLVRIGSRLLIFNSGRRVEYDIRNDLFAHLTRFPPSFYQTMTSGQIMSRAVNDLTQVRLLLGPGLLNLTNTGLVYLVAVPLLFLTDAELASYCLLSLPALFITSRRFARKMYEKSIATQEKLATLSGKVQENLGGTMTIRAYRREQAELASFGVMTEEYLELNVALARFRGAMFPLMGLFGAFGTVMLLYVGGHRLMEGRMTVGQFVEFNAYLAALTWPTLALGWMLAIWQRGVASMKRLNDIFSVSATIGDGPQPYRGGEGLIELRELSYSYPSAAQPALRGVSTRFRPGEMVVIVGRTGSGKTTLLKAIARFLEVPKASVFLDGQDVLELPLSAVRAALSYAPQDAFLFSRTIAENVAFGSPDASLEQIERAVAAAGLSSDLAGFPDGLETIVGERGITLSGGQRQRTALARALLVEPKVLLLDDTLASVDTETERKILAELARTAREKTTILVTHRLACAALADRILVMDQGRIVEQGTEDELILKNGIYAEMHRRQRIEQNLDQQLTRHESLPAETAAAMSTP